MSKEVASLEITLVRCRFDGLWYAGFTEMEDCPTELATRLREAVCETLKQYNNENDKSTC